MSMYRQILSWGELVPAAHAGGSGAGWCYAATGCEGNQISQSRRGDMGKGYPIHAIFCTLP